MQKYSPIVGALTQVTVNTPAACHCDRIIDFIRSGIANGWRIDSVTENIRNEPDKKKRREMKKAKLPAFMASCMADTRSKDVPYEQRNIQPTNLVQCDIDDFESEAGLQGCLNKLIQMPSLYFAYRSPSGNGLKAIFRVEGGGTIKKHEHAWLSLAREVERVTGRDMDKATKDLCRPCYICYDPNIYVNPNPAQLSLSPEVVDVVHQKPVAVKTLTEDDRVRVVSVVDYLVNAGVLNIDCYKDWLDVCQQIQGSYPGQDGFELTLEVSQRSNCFDADECLEKWDSFKDPTKGGRIQTVGTLFDKAAKAGWTGPNAMEIDWNQGVRQAEVELKLTLPCMSSLVCVRTMQECVNYGRNLEPSKRLFDEFMFEHESAIVFSDMGAGKTALGMQVAQSLASGTSIPGFPNESPPLKVLYCDFELSDRQIANRYGDGKQFHPNLHRLTLNPDADFSITASFGEIMVSALGEQTQIGGFQVLIVDNVTYLGSDLTIGEEALLLMKKLKAIKDRLSITMLVMAHTPKRKEFEPLVMNDLGGSRMIPNFVDSVFAIGPVKGVDDLRYLKQLKVRSSEKKYGASNVVLCRMAKVDGLLQFVHQGNRREEDLIKGSGNGLPKRNERRERILELAPQFCKLNVPASLRWVAKQIAKCLTKGDERLFKNLSWEAVFESKYRLSASDLETPSRVVSCFFGSNTNYLQRKVLSEAEERVAECSPAKKVYTLITKREPGIVDGRAISIEVQIDYELEFNSANVELVIFPSEEYKCVVPGLNKLDIEYRTYFDGSSGDSGTYFGQIFEKLMTYYESTGLLI